MFRTFVATTVFTALTVLPGSAQAATTPLCPPGTAATKKVKRHWYHPPYCEATQKAHGTVTRQPKTALPPSGTELVTAAKGGTTSDTNTALTGSIGANVDMEVDHTQVVLHGRHGLRVTVTNNTKSPLEFNGDCAQIHLGKDVVNAASLLEIIRSDTVPPTVPQILLHILVDAATVGMADTAHDEARDQGPILERYGADEARRQDETSRFGKRVLWPGDQACGTLFFDTDRDLNGGTIDLPVAVFVGTKDPNSVDSMDLMNLNAGMNTPPGTAQGISPSMAEQNATNGNLTSPNNPSYMPPAGSTGTTGVPFITPANIPDSRNSPQPATGKSPRKSE